MLVGGGATPPPPFPQDSLRKSIPPVPHQWARKRLQRPYLSLEEWLSKGSPGGSWVLIWTEGLPEGAPLDAPTPFGTPDDPHQGVLHVQNDRPPRTPLAPGWWLTHNLMKGTHSGPRPRLTKTPTGTNVLSKNALHEIPSPYHLPPSSTLMAMAKVTAPTPWNTTSTYWPAQGSTSGVEVAELCCGAFATFAAAASQLSLRPSLTMDYDRTRCAHVQSWWTEHWTPCTHICGDISQKPHWSRQAYMDIWAIGIPCQSTSTAGNQRGRADRRDLYSTLLELLTYVRPPQSPSRDRPGILGQDLPTSRTVP